MSRVYWDDTQVCFFEKAVSLVFRDLGRQHPPRAGPPDWEAKPAHQRRGRRKTSFTTRAMTNGQRRHLTAILMKLRASSYILVESAHFVFHFSTHDLQIKMPFDGNPHKVMGLIAHPGGISSFSVSGDGSYLATAGGKDLTVNLWKVNTQGTQARVTVSTSHTTRDPHAGGLLVGYRAPCWSGSFAFAA